MSHLSHLHTRRLFLLALVVALAVTPFASSAAQPQRRVVIGSELRMTGPTTVVGTWIASGAYNDSGTRSEQLVIGRAHNDEADISGTVDFVGTKGTFSIRFTGTIGPLSLAPHLIAEGRFAYVSGTGAYLGIRGNGTFQFAIDLRTRGLGGAEAMVTLAE